MSDQSPADFDGAEWSPADELIVATDHLGFVLEHVGSRIAIQHNSWLGLTRLGLPTRDVAAALDAAVDRSEKASRIKRALAEQGAAVAAAVLPAPQRPPEHQDEDEAVDWMASVLADLRALAVAEHGGWMPTMGRNRLVELPGTGELAVTNKTSYGKSKAAGLVGAANKTSYGGTGEPIRLSGPSWTVPGARAAGPGAGVRVGLVDTSVWPHPWLAGGWVARPSDLLAPGTPLGAATGHGTFVAGLILSQAPGATIEVRSALDAQGQGTTWQVAEAIADLARSGVSVINLSFAGYTADGQPPLVLARAVDRVDAEVVVVAAAGNHAGLGHEEGEESAELEQYAALPSWPAALDDVLAVGSLGSDGSRAPFSPSRPWVDLAVRGEDVRSTYIPRSWSEQAVEQDWVEWSGTSFSAALVSGVVAAGVDPGRLTARDVLDDLLSTASRRSSGGRELRPSAPGRLRLRDISWPQGPVSS